MLTTAKEFMIALSRSPSIESVDRYLDKRINLQIQEKPLSYMLTIGYIDSPMNMI